MAICVRKFDSDFGAFAPHITEELWREMGHDDTVHVSHWPKWDEKYLKSDTMTIIVQVNGKLRAKLELPSDMDNQGVEEAALADENVQKFTNNKPPKRWFMFQVSW